MACCVQKLDLLAKESVLLRDRQQLTRQVEFLHRHVLPPAASDDTLNSCHHQQQQQQD